METIGRLEAVCGKPSSRPAFSPDHCFCGLFKRLGMALCSEYGFLRLWKILRLTQGIENPLH